MRITPTHPPSPPAVARFPRTATGRRPDRRVAPAPGPPLRRHLGVDVRRPERRCHTRLALQPSGVTPEDAVLVVAPLEPGRRRLPRGGTSRQRRRPGPPRRPGRRQTACAANGRGSHWPRPAMRIAWGSTNSAWSPDGGGTELAVPAARTGRSRRRGRRRMFTLRDHPARPRA